MSPPIKRSKTTVNDAAAKQRSLALREAKAKKVKLAKVRRSFVFMAAILLPLGLMSLLVVDYIYRPGSFAINEIRYEGEFSRVDHTAIDEITRGSIYGNFFTVNLDYLRSRLEVEPWVSRAAVRREWPGRVVVRVFEHSTAMRWQDDAWVSNTGKLILANKTDKSQVEFLNLVSLGGDKTKVQSMMAQAYVWQHELEENALQLTSLQRTNAGAWQLLIETPSKTNSKVLLGSEQIEERFARLMRMMTQNHHLFDVSKVIDVRYPNGIAISPSEDALLGALDRINTGNLLVQNNE